MILVGELVHGTMCMRIHLCLLAYLRSDSCWRIRPWDHVHAYPCVNACMQETCMHVVPWTNSPTTRPLQKCLLHASTHTRICMHIVPWTNSPTRIPLQTCLLYASAHTRICMHMVLWTNGDSCWRIGPWDHLCEYPCVPPGMQKRCLQQYSGWRIGPWDHVHSYPCVRAWMQKTCLQESSREDILAM